MMQHLFILTGASRGLGLAMAQQLLQPGHTLLCLSRHANEALATQAGGCGATLIQWSQNLADGVTASVRLAEWLATQAADAYASATLINNAGVIPRIGPLATPMQPTWPTPCAWDWRRPCSSPPPFCTQRRTGQVRAKC